MGQVIGDLLPLAIGVALSPIPVVATILMILSARGRGAATGFATGWVLGILLVTGVVTIFAGALDSPGDSEPGTAASWIKVVLGLLLVGLAVKQWQARSDTEVPGWMRAIDTLTPVKAAGLGALLSGVNPKNLLLCVSAGVAIGAAGLGTGGTIGAIVVFTVLASATVLTVVLGYLLAAERLGPALDHLRVWLQDNNHAVLAIVLLIMGAVVLGKGLGGL
ncbi:GAP family protein [Nocardia caishijiensis]|uniref:Sap-like sulfolipid-1-addressing protein n=1 Tax=Nocardia caishijiensis TaxID=184756 RepID=A0ABQ6YHV0_9NOCA|nr:GAP family protein [Nocardia caishijiensis]KAF0845349.1 Sap-like sulfolipid-1-addressing protein [Nocardia caishijiensis]